MLDFFLKKITRGFAPYNLSDFTPGNRTPIIVSGFTRTPVSHDPMHYFFDTATHVVTQQLLVVTYFESPSTRIGTDYLAEMNSRCADEK